MLKIQNEKFQEDGVYLPDEGESNVGVDAGAEVDAVVYAGVFQDVNLDGGAGVVGDVKAQAYVGVEVDMDAPVEVLVGKDVDVDVAVVRDASLEKYANVNLDVHAGVDVDVGLGASVESDVEVSMHFFFCSYTVGPLKGGNAQDKSRNMFRVNLLQGHPISYNVTTFFSKKLD